MCAQHASHGRGEAGRDHGGETPNSLDADCTMPQCRGKEAVMMGKATSEVGKEKGKRTHTHMHTHRITAMIRVPAFQMQPR